VKNEESIAAPNAAPSAAPSPGESPRSGTVRSALRHRGYRTLYVGSLLSNIGSWMQNIVLIPFAYKLAKDSAGYAGVVTWAQLGPVLALSVVGGVLSGRLNRRWLMTAMQAQQALAALWLAWLANQPHPSRMLVIVAVLVAGIGNALGNPTWQAVLPEMVPREDLAGVVSLNSTMINGSRVIGPLIVAVLGLSVSQAMVANAATFLFIIIAIQRVPIPNAPLPREGDVTGWRQLTVGVRVARDNIVVGRLLVVMMMFSLCSLAFVGQFPAVAEQLFRVGSKTTTYRFLYATWGVGAMMGALAMGTVLATVDKARLARPLMVGFAAFLAAFSLLRSAPPAFPIGFVLGFCYFGTTTAMLTVLQSQLTPRTRPSIMALWFMAFGGTISLTGLWSGWAIDHLVSPMPVMLFGAVSALGLAVASNYPVLQTRMRR
jgi:MFS family permease